MLAWPRKVLILYLYFVGKVTVLYPNFSWLVTQLGKCGLGQEKLGYSICIFVDQDTILYPNFSWQTLAILGNPGNSW